MIGRPFRTASCLGFLSAAAAGISIPRETKVLKERKHARSARGVRRTCGRLPGEIDLERRREDFSITFRLTPGGGKSCWAEGWCGLRIVEERRETLGDSKLGLIAGLEP